jgi:Type ISP C-terminal specificity domain
MDMPRRDLWAARIPGQVFVIEQHSHVFSDGPGIVLSALIPDFHHFNTRGGRTLPYLYPDGTPNLAPGLARALAGKLARDVTNADVLAYIAAVVAHPAYTQTFADELTTPGIRVPVTRDPDLWAQAAKIGVHRVTFVSRVLAPIAAGSAPTLQAAMGPRTSPVTTP